MKKALVTLLCLFMPWTLQACGIGDVSSDGYENASVEHAYQHWQQGEKSPIPFAFVDVRTAKEFAVGHVPGAIHIPLQQLAERMKEIPKDKQVYVYCEAGVRSAKASRLLVKSGYQGIENIGDGMRGWREHRYPQE